ncbi:protein krasavietz isoform X2 [Eurytemora carolleeae]|uniref:protein krasavietz isoform X2 n=1 Tax=Eurytemora carolleeae TaxID=1294199 RepID=UPI000C793F3F|nr:protein krasavietz isoform X2 [Eurytemora carolleeae]|eukprot:XP_023349375.1 protein krasavietz-like isoform X2 [Eurytemora affinis]
MSQKVELPSLTGHRTKTRKRDEKKIYDPTGFRDFLVESLESTGSDLEALFKFLDAAGNKTDYDYRRYGEALLEILIAGGLLAPGGSIAKDGDKLVSTNFCVFQDATDLDRIKAWDQVFIKLMRRYKYLEKMLTDEMKKILVYLRGFSEEHRSRLAQITALWVVSGLIAPNTLAVVINEHQVKDGIALNFILEIFATVKAEKSSSTVVTLLKRSGLELNLELLFPPNKRTPENIKNSFLSADLLDVVTYLANQENAGAKKDIQRSLRTSISEGKPVKEIIVEMRESVKKNGLQEAEAVSMIWSAVMTAVEWNKKEDLVQDQALKHIKQFIPLFAAFTTSAKSEMVLLNKIQDFCYDNQNFLKCFNKIVLLFYKTEVLSEEVILKWYKDGHAPKGWTVFMGQMKKFIEWLEHAESGIKNQRVALSLPVLAAVTSSAQHPWIQNLWLVKEADNSLQLAAQSVDPNLSEPEAQNIIPELILRTCESILNRGCTDSTGLVCLVQKSLKLSLTPQLTEAYLQVLIVQKLLEISNLELMVELAELLTEYIPTEVENWVAEYLEHEEWKYVQAENYSPLYPAPKFLIQLCSQSNILFTRATAVFQTILRETGFNAKILHLYRSFLVSVLQFSSDPISLFPGQLRGLANQLLRSQDLADISLSSDTDTSSGIESTRGTIQQLVKQAKITCPWLKLSLENPLSVLYPHIFSSSFITTLESEEEDSDEE